MPNIFPAFGMVSLKFDVLFFIFSFPFNPASLRYADKILPLGTARFQLQNTYNLKDILMEEHLPNGNDIEGGILLMGKTGQIRSSII